jgi:hypothetical protein
MTAFRGDEHEKMLRHQIKEYCQKLVEDALYSGRDGVITQYAAVVAAAVVISEAEQASTSMPDTEDILADFEREFREQVEVFKSMIRKGGVPFDA